MRAQRVLGRVANTEAGRTLCLLNYNIFCTNRACAHEPFAVLPVYAAADFILTIFGTCVNIYNGVTLLVDEVRTELL